VRRGKLPHTTNMDFYDCYVVLKTMFHYFDQVLDNKLLFRHFLRISWIYYFWDMVIIFVDI
jgi:hypothetical protein